MSIADEILRSPLELSLTAVVEPGPGLLVATAKMTQGRAAMAGLLACVAILFVFLAWRARHESLFSALWPWGALAPFFAIIAAVLGLGSHRKSYDAGARSALVTAGIGPLHFERRVALPEGGVIRVTVRREYSSRAGGRGGTSTRWYDVAVADAPELGFTVPSDRDAARAMAARLAKALNYAVKDEAEDDGVERLKP